VAASNKCLRNFLFFIVSHSGRSGCTTVIDTWAISHGYAVTNRPCVTLYFLLYTSYFILPTLYFLLYTSYFILPTLYFLLRMGCNAHCNRSCPQG
jgi:hypothetical protein